MNKNKHLKKETKLIKIERNLYIASVLLFLSSIIINILNIIYYPYLINGLILELNILMICICTYSLLKNQKKINLLKDKRIKN